MECVDKKDTIGYQLKTRIGDFADAIKDDFFDIKQIGNDTLSVKFNVNDSSEDRSAIITLESVNCFKTVTIRQAGK